MPSAALTGFMPIKNPRPLDAKRVRTVVFDALIWLPDGQAPLAGSFRYYNSKDIVFADDSMFYVHAKISKFEKGAAIGNSPTPEEDYDLLGDVVFLLPSPKTDPRNAPMVHLAGTAANVKTKNATFELTTTQFISALREGPSELGSTGSFPAICTIHDSPRWKVAKKPVPRENSHVYVSGYLTSFVKSGESQSEGSESRPSFGISVESVDFMGQSTVPADAVTPSPATSLKRGLTFNFDDFGTEKSEVEDDASPTKKPKATNGKSKAKDVPESSSAKSVNTRSSTGSN